MGGRTAICDRSRALCSKAGVLLNGKRRTPASVPSSSWLPISGKPLKRKEQFPCSLVSTPSPASTQTGCPSLNSAKTCAALKMKTASLNRTRTPDPNGFGYRCGWSRHVNSCTTFRQQSAAKSSASLQRSSSLIVWRWKSFKSPRVRLR